MEADCERSSPGRLGTGALRVAGAVALGLVLASTSAGAARAQDAPDGEASVGSWDRPWQLELSLGFGTPVGLIGAHVERRVEEWLAVRGGIGHSGHGVQGAAMARLRVPGAPAASYGLGLSVGPYRQIDPLCECELPYWELAAWNNHELSVETRSDGGFVFRIAFGAAVLLNPGSSSCGEDGICDDGSRSTVRNVVPYFGLAFGLALE